MERNLMLRAVAVVLTSGMTLAAQDTSLGNRRFSLVLGGNGVLRSLTHLADGRECLDPKRPAAFATATVAGKTAEVDAVSRSATGLELHYRGVDTVVTYAVEANDNWLRFRVATVTGTRPERLTLFTLNPAITESVGRRLAAAYDAKTTISLMAGNQQTSCSGREGAKAVLTATTQDAPGPKLEGAAVALIVCSTPEFRAVARQAAHAFGLLTNETADGVPAKDTEAVRGSYFFLGFGQKDADKAIDYCRQAGFRQVMLSSGAWCTKVGHYTINEHAYPDGLEGLKQTVDRLRAAGILVGMHCFASKISKTDAYVTPVPDPRFWHQFEAVLDQALTPEQTQVQVRGDLSAWAGGPKSASAYWEGGVVKHRDLIIGEEAIQYESIGPEGAWNTFQVCRRGAYGTRPAAHPAGAAVVHYGVDGCINGYIIDQETTLLDEAQDRLASIFNTCGFEMVYFDGGEDVDRRRFDYYVSKFQENAMRKFTRRPILHMGTIMTHRLWHSFARSSTVDTYLNTLGGAIIGGKPPEKWPTVRDHIDVSVRYMLSVKADLMPGELGWFGVWPRLRFHGQDVDGLQLDETEYLMCKSLAYDAAISLQTDFGSLEAHRLTPEILHLVRTYEGLRISREFPPEVTTPLRELGQDFVLLQADGQRRFIPVTPLDAVGGSRDVRATVGALDDGAVATLWHVGNSGTVTLDLPATSLRAVDLDGQPVAIDTAGVKPCLRVDGRRTALLARGVSPAALSTALTQASIWTKPPEVIVVRAADARRLVGQIALGSKVGVTEAEAHGDVLVGTAAADFTKSSDWFAEYTVTIPHDGAWHLWSRQRYPSGTDQSFAFVPEGETPTFSGQQVLGNCGRNEKKWHWAGQGGGSTTVPPGEPIRLSLKKGPYSFHIHPRECGASPAGNPRLDLILFVDDPAVLPNDELADNALRRPAANP